MNDTLHTIEIPPKPDGVGSGANGGELLFLALATCDCNDICREAQNLGMVVKAVNLVKGANPRSIFLMR